MDNQQRIYRNRASLHHLNGTQENGWINLREFGRRGQVSSGDQPIEHTIFAGSHQQVGKLIETMRQYPSNARLNTDTLRVLNGVRESNLLARETDENLRKTYEAILTAAKPKATLRTIATELTALRGEQTSCNLIRGGLEKMLRAYAGDLQRQENPKRKNRIGFNRRRTTSQ